MATATDMVNIMGILRKFSEFLGEHYTGEDLQVEIIGEHGVDTPIDELYSYEEGADAFGILQDTITIIHEKFDTNTVVSKFELWAKIDDQRFDEELQLN